MWNVEDVPIPDSPNEKDNDQHPCPFEQGHDKIETTLAQGIDAMQSNKASTQGQPHDPTETTILIQVAQTQLGALALRIHSPSNQMEQSLHLNIITNCYGRIHDSIVNLESIALASSEYGTTPSFTPSNPPRDELERFLMSTGNRAKHRHSVYGTNVNPIWKEKTSTITPLDVAISLLPAPSIRPHASFLPTTHSEDMTIDGLSLPPSPIMMDIQSSII